MIGQRSFRRVYWRVLVTLAALGARVWLRADQETM
jgi:hypothetical protein